jgi:PKD repeat protein
VAFTDASTDPSGWAWDFGDGNTSTEQNPTNTYTAAGTYTVCLVVTNPCSADTSCSSITVTACATPVASFTSSSSDLTVTFADASTNTTSWSWDFGDGNTSNSQNPTYSYSAAGTYNVCLIANSGCETDTICNSVTVAACPAVIAVFTQSDSSLTVNFTDLSVGADTWSWDFGDGFFSTTQNASHTYATAGTYTACLTAANNCTSDSTCSAITVTTVGIIEGTMDKFTLYPNPTQGMLYLSVPADVERDNMTFTIYNLLGEVVITMAMSEMEAVSATGKQQRYLVDLGHLAKGSYVIKVLSGDKLYTEHVIFSK